MKTLNGLPVYRMTINEDDNITGVEYISLVDKPAIQVDWVAMSNQKQYFANADQQILTGPAMIPNLPIYRFDNEIGEYYVEFTETDIKQIARKFNKEQRTLGINYQHQKDSQVKSALIEEQWFIKDTDNDYSKSLGFDLPIGTWMVSVYIKDTEFWNNEVKTGNVRGFSIEGCLNLEMKSMTNKMNKQVNTKYAEIKSADGTTYFIDGEIAIDSLVYSNQDNNILIDGKSSIVKYPYWGSIIELEDGTILTLENAKILIIEKKETQMNKFNVEIKTKDGMMIVSTADSISEGVEVYTVDADGNQLSLEDADYILDDGSTITVKGGKVTAIVTAEVVENTEADLATETNHEVTPEDIQKIMDSIGVADLIARIEALEKMNTEMSAKFSSIPGSVVSVSERNDVEQPMFKTKMSIEDKVNAISNLRSFRK